MARQNPRAIVVTIALLIFFFYPTSQPAAYAPSSAERQRALEGIEQQWDWLRQLNESSYGDFAPALADDESRWLNLTGLRATDGYAWELLSSTRDKARALLQRTAGQEGEDILDGKAAGALPLFRNITGDIRGAWVRSAAEENVSKPAPNLTAIAPGTTFSSANWERNITGREGTLQIRLSEEDSSKASTAGANSVSAIMAIQDEKSTGGGWDVSLHGVHLVDYGSIILTTKSAKFTSIYALPHFALSASEFSQMQANINVSMSEALAKRTEELNAASSIEFEVPTPKCEMVVYLQQHIFAKDQQPLDLVGLQAIEHELRFPSGKMQAAPPIIMSMALFSPDCGFALESKGPPDYTEAHLRGQKSEVRNRIVRNVLLGVSILMVLQLLLLMQQMRISSTPSRQSKIAIRTLTMLAMGDYIVLLLASLLIPVVDTLFITLMVVTFFSIVGGSLIPNKFLLEIWNAQEPERVEAMREVRRRYAAERAEREEREAQQAANAETASPGQTQPPPAANVTSTRPLPLPVTAIRFTDTSASALATPIPPAGGFEPQLPTFGTLYTTNALLLLAIFFLTAIALTTFPQVLLYIYTRGLSLMYLSPWIPQIMRSARRNTARPLLLRFVAGQSLLRLMPFIWLWGRPDSLVPGKILYQLGLGGGGSDVLNVQPDPGWLLVLAAWLWLQFIVLAAQEVLGARWFTWRGWPWDGNLPDAWDWGDVGRLRARTRARAQDAGEEEKAGNGVDPAEQHDPQPVIKVKSSEERTYECAICMQHVDVPLSGQSHVEAAGSLLLGMGKARDYMITPCGHVFHKQCLEGWMGYRLQCPICREGLPPL